MGAHFGLGHVMGFELRYGREVGRLITICELYLGDLPAASTPITCHFLASGERHH